jgi:GNAT superfamily N-acetyltransferase
MPLVDLSLAKRLERSEGFACAQYAAARRRLFPQSGAEWIECAGTYAVFDGVDSPITQTFGLGIFEPATPSVLDTIETFFRERGAPVFHEVSPFAGVETLQMLCSRKYRPIEISNVLYREVERPRSEPVAGIHVHPTAAEEAQLWADINAKAWAHSHPELYGFLSELGAISAVREGTVCFLAELEGKPSAAGALCLYQGVALFAGAATLPESRRRGLQSALLEARMRYAVEHGCDLAMVGALPGSESQRNAERNGFHVAYTRTKWELRPPRAY